MARQIVGFFDNRTEAERVKDDLLASGIDRNDIDIMEPSSGGEPGFWEKIKDFFGAADEQDRQIYAEAARRGAVAVSVDADNDVEENRAVEVMQRYNAIDLDQRQRDWQAEGWQATRTTQPTTQRGEEVLPVTEEELRVGKRAIQRGGLRIYSKVTERPVEEQVQLREERVEVERRPVDRPLTEAEKTGAFKERTIEARETSEEPVISKEARVVEEVGLKKDVEQRTETVRDTVRRTDVEVERISDEDRRFADTFAGELAKDERYRDYDWRTLEPEAQRSFEQRYPGRKWDQIKDAIHTRYDRMHHRGA